MLPALCFASLLSDAVGTVCSVALVRSRLFSAARATSSADKMMAHAVSKYALSEANAYTALTDIVDTLLWGVLNPAADLLLQTVDQIESDYRRMSQVWLEDPVGLHHAALCTTIQHYTDLCATMPLSTTHTIELTQICNNADGVCHRKCATPPSSHIRCLILNAFPMRL